MCGIAGIVSLREKPVPMVPFVNMTRVLSHRGPDGEGYVVINSGKEKVSLFHDASEVRGEGNAAFSHRRLSIIDLSEAALQPMSMENGKIWIVYNGEIYNYLELRKELENYGNCFETSSDTEVVLKAYLQWGKGCLHKFNGMWAFVICDLREKLVFGARDRFGIKPLYYHSGSGYFSFASEIKALLQLSWVHRAPCLPVVKDYLYHSRVNVSKYTFFEDILELEPGHCFEIDINRNGREGNFKKFKWWYLRDVIPVSCLKDEREICEQFRELLVSSIKLRLRSDVPVGTCLSGGLDSSSIVCLARPYLSMADQNTFSIVYPGFKYDESFFVDEIVRQTGVIPHKDIPKGEELLEDINHIVSCQGEPFTSTSMYAQWRVFRLSKRNGLKVTLDGQGADELLAGYSYFFPVYWAELMGKFAFKEYVKEISFSSATFHQWGQNFFMTFAGFLKHRTMIRMAGRVSTQYNIGWINHNFFKKVPLPIEKREKVFESRLNQRLYEVFTYDGLPALLRYSDRNAMAHSIESRMPFLDHRLVSFLFSLPPRWKIRNGHNKYVMRKSLIRDVPKEILERKDKIGFVTPEAEWFRKECGKYFKSIIESDSFLAREFFNVKRLKDLLSDHISGKLDASRPIWRAINLELWLKNNM